MLTGGRSIFEAFYINVRGSLDRQRSMEDQFKAIGVRSVRVEAVTPKDSDCWSRFPTAFLGSNPGQVAVLCSWMRALANVVSADCELALITEDDAVFKVDTFMQELTATLRVLPSGWEGLHLGTSGITNLVRSGERFMGSPWPTYVRWRPLEPLYPGAPDCLLLNRSFAAKLLSLIEDWCMHRLWQPVDVVQGYIYRENQNLKVYVADRPQLCGQGDFLSEFSAQN